jgi:hypothetical protein
MAVMQRTATRLFVLSCPRLLSHCVPLHVWLQAIDRKQRECKEAARNLYGVQRRYCQVTDRIWEPPEIVSCSHIMSRSW